MGGWTDALCGCQISDAGQSCNLPSCYYYGPIVGGGGGDDGDDDDPYI